MAADTEGATGTEYAFVGSTVGKCIWCGHLLRYIQPGSPPGDCTVAGPDFYLRANTWRDYSLVDFPPLYGKFCQQAPPHPLGMLTVHEMRARTY